MAVTSASRTSCPLVTRVDSAVTRVATIFPNAPGDDIRLVRLISCIADEMSSRFDGMLRPHGLNETDFRTLMQLFCNPERQAYPSDLSELATQSRTNMTRIVDSLVARGWVSRTASDVDRRRVLLEITDEGVALVKRLLPQFHPKLSAFLSVLSEREKQVMTQGLQKIAAVLHAQHAGEQP